MKSVDHDMEKLPRYIWTNYPGIAGVGISTVTLLKGPLVSTNAQLQYFSHGQQR